ncbi:MAG: urease accessory UreF family protein [Rubrivivax sp.]
MATGTTITTTAESAAPAALLQLLWLASPALPVGAFSYSEGLEAAVDAGLAVGEDGVRRWLIDQLWLVQARSEGPLLAAALRAWRAGDTARIQALNDWALATRESAELRQQAEQMGRSMADWLRQRAGDDDAPVAQLLALRPAPAWPLAAALAAARSGAAERDALLALAFGWAENLVQAAVKAVPLGQNAGQRVLAALAAEIPAAVDHALALGDDERQAFGPGLAILSARHEAQYSRLFRS